MLCRVSVAGIVMSLMLTVGGIPRPSEDQKMPRNLAERLGLESCEGQLPSRVGVGGL